MKEIRIQTEKLDNGDIEAFVEYNGEIIESHTHGGYGHIFNDWGFRGHDTFKHKEDLLKVIAEDFILCYGDEKVIIKKIT